MVAPSLLGLEKGKRMVFHYAVVFFFLPPAFTYDVAGVKIWFRIYNVNVKISITTKRLPAMAIRSQN